MLCAMTIFRTRTLKFLPLLIIFIGMGVAAVASAQVIERKLHEYFQTPASYDELRASGPETGSTQNSSSSTQPPRLPSREPGEPPPLTLSASEDEPLVGEDGPQSSRPMDNPQGGLDPLSAQNQLDDNTDRVDELDYYSSFDPSVIPFKRLVSQNLVRYQSGQYVFAVDPQRFTTLPIDGGEPRSDEDVFWGTFLVKASPGVSLPIASVAPGESFARRVIADRECGAQSTYHTGAQRTTFSGHGHARCCGQSLACRRWRGVDARQPEDRRATLLFHRGLRADRLVSDRPLESARTAG